MVWVRALLRCEDMSRTARSGERTIHVCRQQHLDLLEPRVEAGGIDFGKLEKSRAAGPDLASGAVTQAHPERLQHPRSAVGAGAAAQPDDDGAGAAIQRGEDGPTDPAAGGRQRRQGSTCEHDETSIGNRFTGLDHVLDWALEHGAVVISPEYRLAPEFSAPTPVEDAYAGFVWAAENSAELGAGPDRILLIGTSAGGGLAAGVTLLARERSGPVARAQMLLSPMLDDRDETVSSRQYTQTGSWSRESNDTGWHALLGDRRKTDAVDPASAPARATDLSDLPPAFIDVGSAEVFRDEDVSYASRLWEAGVQAELHVWAGGFHIFDGAAPFAALSRAAVTARDSWIERTLAR